MARKLAAYGEHDDACKAYTLAAQESGCTPREKMEAAAFILQFNGDYEISYRYFLDLYHQGFFQEDIRSIMDTAFYQPNVQMLKSNYKKNCKLLKKYPYIFQKDFPPFEELPIRFIPFDDHSFTPFYAAEKRFGTIIDFEYPVVSRNFFRDLEKPILAEDVYSQYELEYLNDNVRPSEYIGRENHIYLHYTDWGTFCSYLQCLNLRPLLMDMKIVFLIGGEISQYPIDFCKQFGIDYSRYPVRPVGIREVRRLIWHTQLSSHNGGDFFNEVFDDHPNLICLPSVMFSAIENDVARMREELGKADNLQEAQQIYRNFENPRLVEELYRMRDLTDKDLLVALFLLDERARTGLDEGSRIAPALFFQPHFYWVTYRIDTDDQGRGVLESDEYENILNSSLFSNFKYIKVFTPLRRITTSHAATVRFMYGQMVMDEQAGEPGAHVVPDVILDRILNRSFMVDERERLFKDSVLVRFEDAKLNPKATFSALAAFLDLPYTESMTYCSAFGSRDKTVLGNAVGFDTETVYRTYDEFANNAERYFIEYMMRDAYEYYGYDFHYYDGAPVDEQRGEELIDSFTTLDGFIRKSVKAARVLRARNYLGKMTAGEAVEEKDEKLAVLFTSKTGEQLTFESLELFTDTLAEELTVEYMQNIRAVRLDIAKTLLGGLRFINRAGQPLHMMPMLKLDPELLEQPLYH